MGISRRMAYVLRHGPDTFGLVLDGRGRTTVLSLAAALGVTEDDVIAVVTSDSKGRFGMRDGMVWAYSGHSIPVTPELTLASGLGVLYHGTKATSLNSILTEGLLPHSRMFVHVCEDVATASEVAARRKGRSVLLVIDAEAMEEEGFQVWRSGNSLLTEMVPPRFIVDHLPLP